MGVSSAVPENLARLAPGMAAGRESVAVSTGRVDGLQGDVLAGCGGYGVSSSVVGSLRALLLSMEDNERFVEVVHDQLVAADVTGGGSMSVDDGVVSAALAAAGVAAAPVVVTVAASELFGVPATSGFVDDPVCAANGNFVHGETDLGFPGRAGSLNVVRVYNSLAAATVGGFGPGWSSIVDARLVFPVAGVIRACLVDGSVVSLRPDGAGRWVPHGRRSIHVVESGDGWRLIEDAGTSWLFDAGGVLSGGLTGGGEVVVVRDGDGRVLRVGEVLSGRFVEYRWRGDRVVGAVASDGRTVDYCYDGDGVLIGVAAAGGTVAYRVDGGLLVSATDADGVTLFVNVFDVAGRVIAQTSPFGRVTDYVYDGPTTVITGDDGVRNVMVHDRDGNVTAVVDGDGSVLRMIYDDHGRATRVTDRVGNVWRYEFDQVTGDLLGRTDPDGLSAGWVWDGQRRVTVETDRAGNTTTFEYSGSFRTPTRVTFADGSVATSVLDGHGLPVSVTDPDGVTVGLVWDTDGQVVEIVSAAGTPVRFEFDPAGFVIRLVDAAGLVSVLERDPAGRVLRSVKPDAVTSYHYTAAGRVDAGVEPGGIGWTARFGSHGALGSITDAAGSTVGFGYDVCGNVNVVSAPDGGVYVSEYDPVGRLTRCVLPSGAATVKRYDANGNTVGVVDAEGRRWSREVDVLGRTVRSVDPDGATTCWTFHPNGEIATVTGPDGRVWRSEIDVFGREIAVVDPGGRRAVIGYSPAGRIIERVSPAGRRERYEYDRAGRCVAIIGVDGVRREFTVDARGRVTAVTVDGESLDYGRDSNGLIATVTAADVALNVKRDNGGRISELIDGAGVGRSFDWDERGLLHTATDPAGGITRYGYDQRGRIDTITTPAGAQTSYGYDLDGHLESVTDPAAGITRMARDRSGTVTAIRAGDGTGWDRTLDPAGRETARTGTDGSLLGSFGYDIAGHLATVGSAGLTLSLMWDESDQLVATTTPAGTRQIERDADGRVTATVDEHGRRVEFHRDDRGRIRVLFDTEHGQLTIPDTPNLERDRGGRLLVNETGDAYRYDTAGRLVEIIPADGSEVTVLAYNTAGLVATETVGPRARRFDYDPIGRLTHVDETGAGITTFGYDLAGRRNHETRPDGTIIEYHWDTTGRLVTIERTEPGAATVSTPLTYDGLDRVAAIGGVTIGYDPAAGLVDRVGQTRIIHAGRHTYTTSGTTTGTTTGTTAGWNQPVTITTPNSASITAGHGLGLGVDGVRILGARVYDPTTRQFLSPDPLNPVPGSNGAASGYTYAWNDPINFVDPTGLRPLSDAEYDQIRTREEQGRLGQAWQAIKDDPWGTLALVGVVAIGVALVVFTGGAAAAVGVGILIGAGSSTAVGVATGTFSPTGAAINGVIGGLSGGAASAATSATTSLATTLPRTIAINAATQGATQAGASAVTQLVTGDHHIDPGTVLTQAAIGAATGAAITATPTIWNRLRPTPPTPGPGAVVTRTPQTTILGENMAERVTPFADATGSRTLGFGSTTDEWSAMTAQQRYQLNDRMLRTRIGEGDDFRYIGQDPLRPPEIRARFDLTRSELLRLDERGIPYDIVSPDEVLKTIGHL